MSLGDGFSFEHQVLSAVVRRLRGAFRAWSVTPQQSYFARGPVPVRWWVDGDAICLVYEQTPFAGLQGVRFVLAADSFSPGDTLYGLAREPGCVEHWATLLVEGELLDRFVEPLSREDVDLGRICWTGDLRTGLPQHLPPTALEEIR